MAVRQTFVIVVPGWPVRKRPRRCASRGSGGASCSSGRRWSARTSGRRCRGPVVYDKLLLATGASPRLLPVPGADPHRVFYLRRVEDCEQLKVTWKTASRVAIVGAGWIGLELAAAARAAGLDVIVMETAEHPLLRVMGREAAALFAALHRRHGVDLRLGVHVEQVTGDDPLRATGVRLGDGSHVGADLVVAGWALSPTPASPRQRVW